MHHVVNKIAKDAGMASFRRGVDENLVGSTFICAINIPFLTCLRNMVFLSSSSIFAMSTRLLIRRRSISHTRKNRRRHTHKSWESVVQWLKSPLFMFPFSSQYGLSHGSSTGRGRTSSQTKSTVGLLYGY